MKKVAIYSPYIGIEKNNIGDRYFIDAFKHIFPEIDFTFFEEIHDEDLSIFDGIFFGGGSFLDAPPVISNRAFEQIKKLPIFYIGVGTETNIDPKHIELMKLAKLIRTRSKEKVSEIFNLNKNTKYIPDIVYSLKDKIKTSERIEKSILVLPNALVMPNIKDPMYKHSAWNYFKSEMSQWLGDLIEEKYKIDYFGMCKNNQVDDYAASYEIISFMNKRKYASQIHLPNNDFETITNLFSKYSLIITQRYHGIVLAEMCNVPYICIHHHDKLKNSYPNSGFYSDYYGLGKTKLYQGFNFARSMKKNDFIAIEKDIFSELKQEVLGLL